MERYSTQIFSQQITTLTKRGFSCVCCIGLTANAAVDKSWTLKSPSESIAVTIDLFDTGAVTYSTKLNGRDMILESVMGINVIGYENFTTGLVYASENLLKPTCRG